MPSLKFRKNKMAKEMGDNSLYPIAVLIDELRNDDVNVSGVGLLTTSSLWSLAVLEEAS